MGPPPGNLVPNGGTHEPFDHLTCARLVEAADTGALRHHHPPCLAPRSEGWSDPPVDGRINIQKSDSPGLGGTCRK